MAQQNLAVCSKCGGINRLPAARNAKEAKCGKCGSKLFSGHPEDVDGDLFVRSHAAHYRS